MSLILYARLPDSSISRLALRSGQHARVGRSEWAELSLPNDECLAEEHFLVKCTKDPAVESLPGNQIVFRGEPTASLPLEEFPSTAVEFIAGKTTFAIHWSPEPCLPPRKSLATIDVVGDEINDESAMIRTTIKEHGLSKGAAALAGKPQSCIQFLKTVVEAELFDDAIRFIAGAAKPSAAVAWVLREAKVQSDAPIISGIETWIRSSQETDRVKVKNAANDELPKPIYWIAQAVVLSGGSIAPYDQEVIAPPKHLVGVCLHTSVRWILSASQSSKDVMNRLISNGLQLFSEPKENGDAAGS